MNGHISSKDNNLGNRLRLLRHQKDWSQDQVAQLLGVSIPAFSKIETGLTTVNMKRLKQLAQIFETTVYDLMHSSQEAEARAADLELEQLKELYELKTNELIVLQIKAIKLYDELHSKSPKEKGKVNTSGKK